MTSSSLQVSNLAEPAHSNALLLTNRPPLAILLIEVAN